MTDLPGLLKAREIAIDITTEGGNTANIIDAIDAAIAAERENSGPLDWKHWQTERPEKNQTVEFKRGADGATSQINTKDMSPYWNIRDVYWRPIAAERQSGEEGREATGRWYLGTMNDALFVIDRPPQPAPDDTGPSAHGRTEAVSGAIDEKNGALIVAAHNAVVAAFESRLAALRAKPSGTFAEGVEAVRARAIDAAEAAMKEYADRIRPSGLVRRLAEDMAVEGIKAYDTSFRSLTPSPPPEVRGDEVDFYEREFYPLSNFASFTLFWPVSPREGLRRFDTSEAVYHWEKFNGNIPTNDQRTIQSQIRLALSAHEAFKIAESSRKHRRPNWDGEKVDVMRRIIRAKAEQHEYVRRKLLETGDRPLVEGSWRDDFWGIGPNRDGLNMLGKLWMELRAEISAAARDYARGEE